MKTHKAGITLIELIIAISLIAILMVALSSIYITSIKNYQQELTQTKLQTEGQTLLDEMQNDIKLAKSVEATYASYSTNSQSVILDLPAIDNNQNFLYSGNSPVLDRIIYYKSGSTLHKLTLANISSKRYPQNNLDKVLTTKLSTLTFSYTPDISTPIAISASFVLNKTVGKYHGSVSMAGKSRMRNQ